MIEGHGGKKSVNVQLNEEQFRGFIRAVHGFAVREGLVPTGATEIGVRNEWADEFPVLVFLVEAEEGAENSD